jgi:hypothetical protein
MKILVERKYKKELYTIGLMTIDGTWYCNTLEDKDRGLDQNLPLATNKSKKVYSQTAIPTGTYKVGIAYWSKYKINVPILYNVPAFTGILIHNGSDQNSTSGCILVGINKSKGKLSDGKKYMVDLTNKIQDAIKRGEEVTITIK